MYCEEDVCLNGSELFFGDCVLYTIICPVLADVKYQKYHLIGTQCCACSYQLLYLCCQLLYAGVHQA